MTTITAKWFKRMVDISSDEKMFITDYKNLKETERLPFYEALGIICYLKMAIISSEYGYFYPADSTAIEKLGSSMGLDLKTLKSILRFMFKRNLLDSEMYKQYGILTNFELQQTHFSSLSRYGFVEYIPEYVYSRIFETYKLLFLKTKKSNPIISNFEPDDELLSQNTPSTDLHANETSLQKFKKFAEAFPEKCKNASDQISIDLIDDSIDVDLLIKKINESPWLKQNFNMKTCFLKYNDIIADKYAPFKHKEKNTEHFQRHDYSNVDLNELFDSYEDIMKML